MAHETTRRALFGTAGLAAVALAAPAVAAVAATHDAVSPELVTLIDTYRKADEARDHHHATVIEPAYEQRRASKKEYQRRVDAIPHVEESGGVSVAGSPITFSSRSRVERRQAEVYLELNAEEPNRSADWNDMIDAARRFIKADDGRNEAIHALGEPSSTRDLAAMEIDSYEPLHAARQRIHDFPCTTLADFRAKLAWIEADDGMDGDDLLPIVMADVARIAKQGGR